MNYPELMNDYINKVDINEMINKIIPFEEWMKEEGITSSIDHMIVYKKIMEDLELIK